MMKNVEYCILMPDGQELEPAGFAFGPNDHDFAAMVRKEALGIEVPASGEPEYLKIMSKFGIAWERMSDCGHMRYAPPGALMFDLVGDYAVQAARDQQLPVMMVKGTNLFSLDEPAVAEHAALFGDRLYKLGEPVPAASLFCAMRLATSNSPWFATGASVTASFRSECWRWPTRTGSNNRASAC